MNKTAIKNFAMWARKKLISEITYKAGLVGITEKGILDPLPSSTDNIQFFDIGTQKYSEISNEQIHQRQALAEKIREKELTSDYRTAFEYIIEEVAYTWFNRLIAIRFMEVNEYLPSKIRVLSSETKGKSEPDMVTTPFDTDMEFGPYEKDRIIQLKHENRLDELFRMLFIKQCNQLGDILPELFEKTNDYTELLLSINFTDSDGIVSHLVNDIDEEDFAEAVEIIGWMYQYYNSEPKDEVFALLKKNVKISKERIPAATQLFTPDWIVRYMVENSLGRLWVEGHPNESLKSGWKYYLEEAEQEESVAEELQKIRKEYTKLKPEDIKVIDPCMGSGHILVYAFDVLMQIYESQGYTQRDAASAIIQNNLYGLDIDDRAYQLAYFAVMMKARKYDRRFFTRDISPKLYPVRESNGINRSHLKYFGSSLSQIERNTASQQMEYIIDTLADAKEYGSILNVEKCDWKLLQRYSDDFNIDGQISLDSVGAEHTQTRIKELVALGEAMAQKYDVVITNPPYMGSSGMNAKVSEYVKKNYPDSKSDLFAVFVEKGNEMTKSYGYSCMVTMQSWMFLSSFEKMREVIVNTKVISNLMHMENMVMGIAFGTAVTNIRNCNIKKFKGTYNHITMKDIDNEGLPFEFPVKINRFAQTSTENFSKIPGSPIAYWVSEKFIKTFKAQRLKNISRARRGLETGNNEVYIKYWYEVNLNDIEFDCKNIIKFNKKWLPHNKGGEYRNWYGNIDLIVWFKNDGEDIRKTGNINGYDVFLKEGITWTALTSYKNSYRFSPTGHTFDSNKGPLIVDNGDNILYYLLAFFISPIAQSINKILNPTLSLQNGDMDKLPIIFDDGKKSLIDELVQENIYVSKKDWDSFETSWDFKSHPLLHFGVSVNSGLGSIEDNEIMAQSEISIEKTDNTFKIYEKNKPKNYRIESAFDMWKDHCEKQFNQLKSNEEELNRIFIDIYGLQDELTPDVEDKDVTVRKADLGRDIRSFISYAVGCMFGRYSLDVEGLAYAGGEWDDSRYSAFIPDRDNCIPLTDEEYFEDDIVGRFVEFVRCVYGADTLEENLDFIADALGGRGDKSRDIIRNYFLKDFYKDHVKTYQKRPIYWMYDSGKQNGFKALIYMHRYNEDTTGVVRVNYLHEIQKKYMSHIELSNEMAENSGNAREIAQAEKRKEKLVKQLKETREYDEKIAHLAISRIAIDLDDGVKVNYEKVQTAQDGKKLEILAKI